MNAGGIFMGIQSEKPIKDKKEDKLKRIDL